MTQEQKALYDLLVKFHELCKEHGLTYWLDGGTLLGAVRHQGFIPWDDDIDVAMPEADFHRLFRMPDKLPEGLVFQNEDNDKTYPFCFGKICDPRVPFDTGNQNGPRGVYIDIFPIVPARKQGLTNRICFDLIQVIGYVILIKTKWTKNVPYKNLLARFVFNVMWFFPVDVLRKMRRMLMGIIRSGKNGGTYCSPGSNHTSAQEFWPRVWCDVQEELTFEGGKYPVPSGWHEYLSRCYGNYMKLPPEQEQKSHHKNFDD